MRAMSGLGGEERVTIRRDPWYRLGLKGSLMALLNSFIRSFIRPFKRAL